MFMWIVAVLVFFLIFYLIFKRVIDAETSRNLAFLAKLMIAIVGLVILLGLIVAANRF